MDRSLKYLETKAPHKVGMTPLFTGKRRIYPELERMSKRKKAVNVPQDGEDYEISVSDKAFSQSLANGKQFEGKLRKLLSKLKEDLHTIQSRSVSDEKDLDAEHKPTEKARK